MGGMSADGPGGQDTAVLYETLLAGRYPGKSRPCQHDAQSRSPRAIFGY